MDRDHDSPHGRVGVAYREEDYASLSRRAVAALIDSVFLTMVVGGSYVVALVVDGFLLPLAWTPIHLLILSGVFLYLSVLKASPLRTIGYRVADIRLVGIDGGRPDFLALAARTCILQFDLSPLFLIADFGLMFQGRGRQTVRDMLARTYVVRTRAHPVVQGPIVVDWVFCFGLFLRVSRPISPAAADL